MALYVSFVTFSVLSLFFGETGVASIEKLNDRRRVLSANMSDLESRQVYLKSMLSTLRSDPEAVIVEARSLGLYRDDDFVVRFDNLDFYRGRPEAGQVLRLSQMRKTEEGFLRLLSLVAGLVVLLGLLVAWKLKDADSKK